MATMRMPNPWLLQDPRTQPAPVPPFGPANYGEPSPWDAYVQPAQDLIDERMNLRPLPASSGMKTSAQEAADEQQKRMSGQQRATWLTPEELLANSAATASIPEVAEQRRLQEQNKALFQMSLREPAVPDLAHGLSLFANRFDRRNPVLPPQPTTTMTAKDIREWAKQQQDDQRDLAKTIISGNAASRSGYLSDQLMQLVGMKNVVNAAAQDPTMGKGSQNTAWLRWAADTDKSVKPYSDALGEAAAIKEALRGSPVAQRNVPIMMAKMQLGPNRLAVREVLMEKGDPAFAEKIMQELETFSKGEITPHNKRAYEAWADTMVDLLSHAMENKRQQAFARGAPIGLGRPDMENYLKPSFVNPHLQPEKKKAPALDIQQLILEELKKK